ncbi:MAG: sigma-70 family RNA polymerase sigma factor [Deltaproteobacteria bacterium]|nr:sigma-70 family RNA polymerase sigma factor [Deltaproteobacteria bacterium]MBN2672062.1 sigma-70 family RNA polymerase sigma factor [Deltaproteobacteria bacterium]
MMRTVEMMALELKKEAEQTPSREADIQLARDCVVGDLTAQRRLANRIYHLVTTTVTCGLNSSLSAEDIVQESLIEVLRSLSGYRGDCSLETWTRKVTVRLVSKAVRKQRRREGLMAFFPRPELQWPEGEAQISNIELRDYLNGLLRRLSPSQALCIQLRYVEELGIAEIAHIVDAPEETVRNRIKRGRAKLQKMISRNPAIAGWLERETV